MQKEICLKVLEGDCQTAVGAHSKIENDEIILEAELFSLDGKLKDFMKKNLAKVSEC
jgi:hydroxymethylbilane synthase